MTYLRTRERVPSKRLQLEFRLYLVTFKALTEMTSIMEDLWIKIFLKFHFRPNEHFLKFLIRRLCQWMNAFKYAVKVKKFSIMWVKKSFKFDSIETTVQLLWPSRAVICKLQDTKVGKANALRRHDTIQRKAYNEC